jgi:hypothetical protein
MKPGSRLRMAFAILFLCLVATWVTQSRKSPQVAESPAESQHRPVKTVVSREPQAVPEAPAPNPPLQEISAVPSVEFTPGHFPGVSVRHEPGTHRPTPPEGTPRTVPQEQEIALPDGRRLIGVTLDETWRIPLRAEAPR